MMNRRTLLAGIAGTIPAAQALAAIPDTLRENKQRWREANPLPIEHPFLAVEDLDPGQTTVKMLLSRYATPADVEIARRRHQMSPYEIAKYYSENPPGRAPVQPRPNYRTVVVDVVPSAERYSTIEEVEDAVLARVIKERLDPDVTRGSVERTEPDPFYHGSNPVMINRQANLIAARSRRSFGNAVMMHAEDMHLITAYADGTPISRGAFQFHQTTRSVGRWHNIGLINSCIDVWVTSDLPKVLQRGEAIVALKRHAPRDTQPRAAEAGVVAVRIGRQFAVAYREPHPDFPAGSAGFFGWTNLYNHFAGPSPWAYRIGRPEIPNRC